MKFINTVSNKRKKLTIKFAVHLLWLSFLPGKLYAFVFFYVHASLLFLCWCKSVGFRLIIVNKLNEWILNEEEAWLAYLNERHEFMLVMWKQIIFDLDDIGVERTHTTRNFVSFCYFNLTAVLNTFNETLKCDYSWWIYISCNMRVVVCIHCAQLMVCWLCFELLMKEGMKDMPLLRFCWNRMRIISYHCEHEFISHHFKWHTHKHTHTQNHPKQTCADDCSCTT